ncbi:16S rRNA (cytidine(1402)-2'-O)-methyltransferase [Salinibacillus xinjiangensis]|uniref:Ribosomal RNA small subunit methyltransferase I n=1 Tax=Salinibacillus xinjiangensis TaxID=1229268 RepID=A0A6G1XBA5_9BACI|nr:16S rRNA (cytidine(1402)-2'-O)-methyltransferase [Salinibacillus xinjiangensis]MRG88160.1 16S rRNA (cytidine(1402)-2'-O)-methyltransferase [Salinibacillus xinjiangensis]
MHIQKSFSSDEKGKLYIVPTPIGNLEDITYRALQILKDVDVIAAEDTRQTQKLLNHFEISTPTFSYHEHNKGAVGEKIILQLKTGKNIALVSDAGMPVISDPGFDLVEQASEWVDVVVLPGANAALTALVGSGLPAEHFYFYGFLPRKKKELKEVLTNLQYVQATLLFYESPYRIKDTLKGMKDVWGPERKIVLARELTKRYEEYVRGTVEEILEWTNSEDAQVRGEFCIVVEGSSQEQESQEQWWSDLSILDHVDHYIIEKGMSNKDAIKEVAKERGIPKREVYEIFHKEN